MKVENLFLNFSGFNIQLIFKRGSEQLKQESFFKNNILSVYRGFIIESPSTKIDYIIEFVTKTNYEIITQTKTKKTYIALFEEKNCRITTYYHISHAHLQLIIRNILQKLLVTDGGVILHASSVLVNNKAYLFLAKSGGGKSTSMRLLSKFYKPLADDTIIIKKEDKKFFLYQTPLQEKNRGIVEKNNQRYEIGKIFLLKKAKFHKIEKIDHKDKIVQKFLEQVFSESRDIKLQLKNILSFIADFDDFCYLYFSLKDSMMLARMIIQYE